MNRQRFSIAATTMFELFLIYVYRKANTKLVIDNHPTTLVSKEKHLKCWNLEYLSQALSHVQSRRINSGNYSWRLMRETNVT